MALLTVLDPNSCRRVKRSRPSALHAPDRRSHDSRPASPQPCSPVPRLRAFAARERLSICRVPYAARWTVLVPVVPHGRQCGAPDRVLFQVRPSWPGRPRPSVRWRWRCRCPRATTAERYSVRRVRESWSSPRRRFGPAGRCGASFTATRLNEPMGPQSLKASSPDLKCLVTRRKTPTITRSDRNANSRSAITIAGRSAGMVSGPSKVFRGPRSWT